MDDVLHEGEYVTVGNNLQRQKQPTAAEELHEGEDERADQQNQQPTPAKRVDECGGKRTKNPLGAVGRWICTCAGTHSVPQWRQNFCCARVVTQASQKKSWQWPQKCRPGIFGWCLHG